jgi:two-component system sensor histidine kinase QseC
VLLVTFVLALVAGLGIYFYVRKALLNEYDEALGGRALALSRLVAWDETGKLIFEIPQSAMAEFRRPVRPSYFEIFAPDGKVFARSESLKGGDLSMPEGAASFWEMRLPDGRQGREVAFRFTPHNESDEPKTPAEMLEHQQPAPHLAGEGMILLADDQLGVYQFMAHLAEMMCSMGTLLAVALVTAIMATVRRGLKPLAVVSQEAERFDASVPAGRFSTRGLPAELRPIVERLNDLLMRVEATLLRERRFTADAAHELRTPIAELRVLADVALKWPQEPGEMAEDFGEVRAISQQMGSLVESLLAMSRCEGSSVVVRARQEDLSALVMGAWKSFAGRAEERELRVTWSLEPVTVMTDSHLLMPVLRNLLANAVEHSPHGGAVECCVSLVSGSGATVEIRNSCDSLKAEDLQHLMEPFWRKDAARSDGLHAGLGLAVAAAYGRLQGIELRPFLVERDMFAMRVVLPSAARAVVTELPPDSLIQAM